MRKKLISGVLSAAMLLGVAFPATPGYAVEEPSATKGMEISKTAVANGDGTYTITLEAYATGSTVITETKKDVPTDIVLVLDQSGSMSNSIGSVSFSAYYSSQRKNSDYYDNRHNGGSANLWHKVGDKYYSVSVAKQGVYSYTKITNGRNYSSSSYYTSYWSNRNNLYALVNGEYQKVTVTQEEGGTWYNPTTYYVYKLPDGTQIARYSGDSTSPSFTGTDDGYLYLLTEDTNAAVYTYTYTDAEGNVQTIGTSTGANTTFGTTLYKRTVSTSGGGSKLNALKSAVTTFVNNVSTKAKGTDGRAGTTDDVAHRVAIVGFASTRSGNTYTNTELLSTNNVVNYASANNDSYKDALVNVNGTNGALNSRLTNAISALAASGDTYLEYGVDMANKIFAQYPVGTDQNGNKERQRVVIVFTDGYPAPSGTDNLNYTMADNAINNASTTKKTYDATVYTVAVLADADPTASITDGFTYGGSSAAQQTVASNRYMHYVSNNYLDATSLQSGGTLNPKANPFNGGDSYYLSAGDADTLNNIFEQISDQIESGGSSAELTSETVIKDIIAPAFKLPAGNDVSKIRVETYQCTGKSGEAYTWTKNATTMGAQATVNGDQVSVTGFNFKENYVGTVTQSSGVSYRGHKLVISFDVVAKDGFLGGNNVYTNTSAGVYKDGEAEEPVLVFNRPQVNVPVKELSVTAADKNVYLTGSLNAAQLQAGATVTAGKTENSAGISLNMNADNYGLEAWQNEYVNIGFKDADGNATTELENLKADTSYTVSVTIDPKSDGAGASGAVATKKTGTGSGNIYVFKPYAEFEDSTIYQGNSADYADNKPGSVTWKHGDTVSTSVTMTGTAPSVSYTYDTPAGKFGECTTVQPTPVVNGISGGSATSFTVHVLKPSVVVNLADTSAYYGTTYTPGGGKAVVSWSDDVHPKAEHENIIGTAPFGDSNVELKYYDSSDATTELGKFTMTKQPAKVYVKAFHNGEALTVTKYITTCDVVGSCNGGHTDTVNGYYTVHPRTCQLTITKKDGAAGEPYVFDIEKKNAINGKWEKYSEATIVGNDSETIYELPVGEYTVKEDTSWSWRYDASYSSEVTLSSGNTSGEITCTNASNGLIYWLNGFSQVLKNIFGIGQN